MKYLKVFEQYSGIDIPDYAWLYMLHIVYGGKFSISSWENDERMGTKCSESLSKFNCVKEIDGNYVSDNRADRVINVAFGANTLLAANERGFKLTRYNIPGHYGYKISLIPRSLFLKKHPKIDKAFNRISELITSHYNSQTCSENILSALAKHSYIKEFNMDRIFQVYNYIPETIKLYRGIKSDYVPKENGYSCWTYSKKQGERFAKYVFSIGFSANAEYSKNPILLETEINTEDIAIFIGNIHGESEAVLKNPVKNVKVEKIKVEKN